MAIASALRQVEALMVLQSQAPRSLCFPLSLVLRIDGPQSIDAFARNLELAMKSVQLIPESSEHIHWLNDNMLPMPQECTEWYFVTAMRRTLLNYPRDSKCCALIAGSSAQRTFVAVSSLLLDGNDLLRLITDSARLYANEMGVGFTVECPSPYEVLNDLMSTIPLGKPFPDSPAGRLAGIIAASVIAVWLISGIDKFSIALFRDGGPARSLPFVISRDMGVGTFVDEVSAMLSRIDCYDLNSKPLAAIEYLERTECQFRIGNVTISCGCPMRLNTWYTQIVMCEHGKTPRITVDSDLIDHCVIQDLILHIYRCIYLAPSTSAIAVSLVKL